MKDDNPKILRHNQKQFSKQLTRVFQKYFTKQTKIRVSAFHKIRLFFAHVLLANRMAAMKRWRPVYPENENENSRRADASRSHFGRSYDVKKRQTFL